MTAANVKKPGARKKWGEPGSKVARKTGATVFSNGGRRPIIVAVYPDGIIGLRLLRHKREEYVAASDIFRQAVVNRVAAERAAKRAAKKGRA